MKKMKNKRKYKWLLALSLIFPITFILSFAFFFDNDLWYLLSQGRYIAQNGLYYKDPFTIHVGLTITVQNWLSSLIFWYTFNFLGTMGITLIVVISSILISYLLYKICMLLSDNNYYLSTLLSFVTNILLSLNFIVTRPQLFSFIILLLLIYILELYVKSHNKKYLFLIPVLSLIQVNLHASLWWMIFLFIIPYIIDSTKFKTLPTEKYPLKPLLITTFISFMMGFCNPYGIKAITFIFTSYGDSYMHSYIRELSPFTFKLPLCKQMLALIILNFGCYALFRKGKTKIRFVCLFLGTMLLGFMAIKSIGHFILVSLFPLAYFFKDTFPKDFSSFSKILQIMTGSLVGIGLIVFTSIGISKFIYYANDFKLDHVLKPIVDKLEEDFPKENIRIYNNFNIGGYISYRGFKNYIDPRAEVFLKANNKRKDIFEEYVKLTKNEIDITDFIKRYNFTHILVQENEVLFGLENKVSNYELYYKDEDLGYYLYVRKDLIP